MTPLESRAVRTGLLLAVGIAVVVGYIVYVVLLASAPGHEATTPVRTLVVVMKENHSFDNYFGTFPGANGIPPGVTLPDGNGSFVAPHWLNASSTHDLPHSRSDMLDAFNNGSSDGFAIVAERWAPGLGNASVGYYDSRQLPGYWRLASEYVLADRYFQSLFGPTIPNRLYSIAGQSGGLLSNSIPAEGVGIPTIFDQLEEAKVSWRYYSNTTPPYYPLPLVFPKLNANPAMVAKLLPVDQLFSDIRAGALASVVFVDPEAYFEIGEHPPANVTVGHDWTMRIIDEIQSGPQWNTSAIFLTWDESGGYYDHVPPPQVDALGYGFRVPFLVVSPYAKRNSIDHTVMDHTSILKFIARNWNLPMLTARQERAADVFSAFEFPPAGTTMVSTAPTLAATRTFSAVSPSESEEGVLPQAVPWELARESSVDAFQDGLHPTESPVPFVKVDRG